MALSFSVCVPEKVVYCCLSFCNSFSREAGNNLAEPTKVNTFERALVEAFANKFPSLETDSASMCPDVCSCSPQSSSSNQELGTRAAWCVSQEFVMSLFPGLLNDLLD